MVTSTRFSSVLRARRGLSLVLPLAVLGLVLIGAIALSFLLKKKEVSTLPFTQRVSAQAPWKIQFPEPMDHQSVLDHLSLPSDVDGSKTWQGDVLVIDPSTPVEKDTWYVVRVDRKALKADGNALGKDLEFTFIVSGAPRVSAHLPATGVLDVPGDSRITLIFDRPMIPLSAVEEHQVESDWPVTIDPQVLGRWRWIGTHAMEFIPSGGLTPSTLYTVRVPAGIKTADGEATEEETTWTFETERPRVLETEPAEGYRFAGPTSDIRLTFNQEMDLQSVAQHLDMRRFPKEGTERAPIAGSGSRLEVRAVRYGTEQVNGKAQQSKKVVIVLPSQPLPTDSTIRLRMTAGVHGSRGDLGSANDHLVTFSTVGPLVVERMSLEYGGVHVVFSSPMSGSTLKKAIRLTPVPDGWDQVTMDVQSWNDNRELFFYPTLKPSTAYTLTIDKNAEDVFGRHFEKTYSGSFTTPPLTPQVSITSKGDFGIFERGKPPVFALGNVNVSAVDLEFARLTLPQFLDIQKQRRANWQFQPSLSGAEGYRSWSVPAKKKLNVWETQELGVEKIANGTLQPGIYALLARAPEFVEEGSNRKLAVQQYFTLTDIALTLKYSGRKALVWATSMKTGEPVKDALIQFHSLDGKTPVTGRTNAQGLFEGELPLKEFGDPNEWIPQFWVTAEKSGDFAFVGSEWNQGMNPGDFNAWSDVEGVSSPRYRMFSYLYTERTVYRPGDTVQYKGIVRLRDWDGNLKLPDTSHSLLVTITDPEGKEVSKKTMRFGEFGTFHDSFVTSPNASLGSYSFTLTFLPESEAQSWGSYAGFSVLAYRKPEYKVDLTTKADKYFDGDTIETSVAGSYYFGAPLAGAKVEWRAETTDYFFNRYTDGWYSFALEDAWCWYACERGTTPIAEGKGTLDAAGRMTIRVPVSLQDKSLGQIATIEASVTDPNNQLVSNRVSVPVHAADVYVGIRPRDYVVTPGSRAAVELVTVDTEGKPLAGQKVDVKLLSREWNTIKKKGVDGEFYYDNEPKDTPVRAISVTTDKDGKAVAALQIDKGGQFRVVAEVRDAKGRTAKAGTSLYAWSNTYVNWAHGNDNRIDVTADKPEYAVGETAKLLVKSPFQGKGVRALVTVERENVRQSRIVDIVSNAQPIEVPITEDLVPNAYVSVVIVKPRAGDTFDENGLDTGAPAFRIGYAQLKIETKKKALTVEVKTDKDSYLPGETVRASLRVTDSDGKPRKAELSLGVVDMSVLALTGFSMPDLVADFYAQHGLGVISAQSLQYLIDRFKPGSKGGGGGLETQKRGNFKDTAYWNPAIVTDESGMASVSFHLPDNLTTWQLLSIAADKENRFGAGAREIVETKRVIVRPVRPRFAVQGDKIDLGAIVHNYLPKKATFRVSLSGSGFTAADKTPKSVSIEPGAQVKLLFPLTIGDGNGATFVLKAETDGARDEIEEKIPVYAYASPQTVATSGMTDSMIRETVSVPKKADASAGDLTVAVSPSLAAFLPGGLEYLSTFPYGCAEQTASAFLPALALSRLGALDLTPAGNEKSLRAKIESGIQTLLSFQRADGGFGYWVESRESYPPLTSYIVYALTMAKKTGYTVDEGSLDRAEVYLLSVLRNPRESSLLDLATRASILYVLAEAGQPDVNLMSTLYEKRASLPLFSKAELAMALRLGNTTASNKKAAELLQDILSSARVDARGAHFQEKREGAWKPLMHTDDRTDALVLRAMVRIDPGNSLIPQTVLRILSSRKDGHWDTTQSTSAVLLSFIEYLEQSGDLRTDELAGIEVNGKMLLTERFTKADLTARKEVRVLLSELKAGTENEVKIGKDGMGKLYYDLVLRYLQTGGNLPAAEEGMSIQKTVELAATSTSAPLTAKTFQVGKTYKVTLTLTIPEDRHFVAVESPHPAGFEAIDLNLQTSAQTGAQNEGIGDVGPRSPWMSYYDQNWLLHFTHREFRDDKVFLFADSLPAGVYQYTYLVRATTPGTFLERPARAWEMYFPEVFGQTSGKRVTIDRE